MIKLNAINDEVDSDTICIEHAFTISKAQANNFKHMNEMGGGLGYSEFINE